jgi:hypothetical protein
MLQLSPTPVLSGFLTVSKECPMRNKSLAVVGSAAAFVLAVGLAGPATADSGTTPVTLEITGGSLSIAVPTDTVSLGTLSESSGSQTASAALGTITVTDNRGGTAGWAVDASANDLTGPQNISVNGPSTSSYTAPTATSSGTVNVSSSNLAGLYPGGIVQTGTGVSGANTASWNPTISILIPGSALAGTYSSGVTHSVN